ncbi:MAG: bifunctional riboflavin kinase/FMN adenylyltransferase [Acidobacteria bacterium]|nr:bifunctional riboflavin kinase/FMN adenylyltransferase [Acidobacteriota bacterium]
MVTIGVFDGVHCAHQELLRRVRERAAEEQAASVAITFDPHPLQVLAPQKAPKLLTPTPVKLELLAKSGLDRLLILPFTEEFSHWPPEKFVEEVLVKTLRAVVVVVGENFRFGYRASGTPAMLLELGTQRGFHTEVLPSLRVRGVAVSSSRIRKSLEEGKLSLANRLLGRPFSIRNPIEAGQGIGRSQTVPTLNVAAYSEMLPATGVYITWARGGTEPPEPAEDAATSAGMPLQAASESGALESAVAGADDGLSDEALAVRIESLSRRLRSVTNVGVRPTFGERDLGVETHLLDDWQGAPPTTLEVSFLYRLRDERKFASPEELKEQILKDIRRAENYFRRLERFGVVPVPQG